MDDKYLARKLTHQLQKNKTFHIGSFNLRKNKFRSSFSFTSACIVYLAFAKNEKYSGRRGNVENYFAKVGGKSLIKKGKKREREREREKTRRQNPTPSIPMQL